MNLLTEKTSEEPGENVACALSNLDTGERLFMQ